MIQRKQPAPAEDRTTEPAETPEAVYTERQVWFAALAADYNQRRMRVANLTVLFFFAPVAWLVLALITGSWWVLLLTIPSLAATVYTFIRQGQLETRYRRYETLATISAQGLARLRRDWDALPPPTITPPQPVPAFAGDLDVLGHASLQQLLSAASTPPAQERLLDWLLSPATPQVIAGRQPAIAELAPLIDFRDELTLFGRLSGMSAPAHARFLEWAEQDPWLLRRPWLIWASRVLPVLTVGLLILQMTGVVPAPLWLLPLGVNILLSRFPGKHAEELIDQVADRQATFQPYAGIFALAEHEPLQAPMLRRIQGDLASGDLNADAQMRRLGHIMQFGDLRLSLIFPVIQAFLLWNYHTLWLLERWQRTAGKRVRRWLDTLSELEALSALASLAYDNPDWVVPEVAQAPAAQPVVAARALGHPLLPASVRVANDVTIGPPGRFLLVTGSNMSGKSTLLRAVGLNAVLAQAGAAVCAEALAMPPVALATSIRISDSLEYGISYFMAELHRLKEVVEIAEAAAGQQVPLFLLDEILHGTNTTERQIAARYILLYLLEHGATGAVSTHDLSLADSPQLAARSERVHFTESFARGPEGPVMRFDYRLRPGIATSSNALKLMEIVGLPVEQPEQ